jgi:hypothetical protein
MNVDIQTLGFRTTGTLSQHTKRRLRLMIARHGSRIKRVLVRLGDINGPRGGIDKFCRIHVYLVDAPAAVIHDIGVDLYDVIDRAAKRADRAVYRHLDQARTFVRHGRAGAEIEPGDAIDLKPEDSRSKFSTP